MKKLLGILLFVFGLGDVLHAAPGDLDTSFSQDGKVTTNFSGNDAGAAIAIQPDGKIVVVGGSEGDFALARYNSSGSLDTSFDGDGRVTTSLTAQGDFATAVAIQPDGKIVVAGFVGFTAPFSPNRTVLVRYNADGSFDTTFSGNGIVSDAILTTVGAVAIQGDGKIVVAGKEDDQFALARFTADGVLDTTPPFNGGGVVRVGFILGSGSTATALVLLPDGTIVAAGRSAASDFALVKINLVTVQFAVTVDLGESDGANALALQADGRIVVAGGASSCLNPSQCVTFMGLARFNANGSLDTTFVGDGTQIISFDPRDAVATAVAIQPDGKIVVAGTLTSNQDFDFVLARLNPDGALDFTFSNDGLLTTGFGNNLDSASAMAIQATDGRIVVAGNTGASGAGSDFALARYHAFSCGSANATRVGTNGPDTLNGRSFFDLISGKIVDAADVILGLGGNDTINGGGNNDILCGGDGNDTIAGGSGNDVLFGQNGRDNHDGGSGTDSCNSGDVFQTLGETFTSCETTNSGLSGFSGTWLELSQKCNASDKNPKCKLAGALQVENPGTETTAVPALVAFYLSADESLDEDDVFLTNREIPVLAAGEVKVLRFSVRVPEAEDVSGLRVIAVLDFTDVVAERNEENNIVVSAPIP